MTSICIFEDSSWSNFLPLVYMRPVCDLVCGGFSFRERISRLDSDAPLSLWVRPDLQPLLSEETGLPVNTPLGHETLLLNGRFAWSEIPQPELHPAPWVGVVGENEEVACVVPDPALAERLTSETMLSRDMPESELDGIPRVRIDDMARSVEWPWELNRVHQDLLAGDLANMLRQQMQAERPGVHLINCHRIHIGRDCRIDPCVVIDASEGPVIIGDGVRISPMCTIQGPAFIGERVILQPGATIRHASWIGPVSKVGGEIEGSIIHGYSNKQHDGFLGHSYVGSWVNIAADCINSDLKNTYGTVRVPILGEEVETGEQFVGALIGDHAKIGINASLPTGTVIGFSSNAVGTMLPKYVPSFSWYQDGDLQPYDLERAVSVARRVMSRRRKQLTPAGEALLRKTHLMASQLERRAEDAPVSP